LSILFFKSKNIEINYCTN